MKDEPPHVEAKVGPVDVVNGQLQLIWKGNFFIASISRDSAQTGAAAP